MNIQDYCLQILNSGNLEDKLMSPPKEMSWDLRSSNIEIIEPKRDPKISFSIKKDKIPRPEELHQPIKRAKTLHHFANHELMAIELYAWAILKFSNLDLKIKKGMLKTIQEEQTHFNLYRSRMRELGLEFGDLPLNRIFWNWSPKMGTFEKFTAIMTLSFEGANLDFSLIYKSLFNSVDDFDSRDIMDLVFRDEINHVKRGLIPFQKSKPVQDALWDYYISHLEYPFTPRRAKAYFFIPESRKKAGFSDDFIEKLGEFSDIKSSENLSKSLQLFSSSHFIQL
jgi:uncharacterized ferritin-like protein (DUF455 family)